MSECLTVHQICYLIIQLKMITFYSNISQFNYHHVTKNTESLTPEKLKVVDFFWHLCLKKLIIWFSCDRLNVPVTELHPFCKSGLHVEQWPSACPQAPAPLFLSLTALGHCWSLISFSIQANKSWIRASMLADQALYLYGTSAEQRDRSWGRLCGAGSYLITVSILNVKMSLNFLITK